MINHTTPAPLWTKNFTIITLGTVVSLMGNTLVSFAMALKVLDYTGSTLYYSIFLVCDTLPSLVLPSLAGPIVDKFSRRKIIYLLDFFATGFYSLLAFLSWADLLPFPVLIGFVLIMGSIRSVYNVAYQSFYPLLISEGNFTKAYSISSTIESLSSFIVPVAALLYNAMGITSIFAVNAVCFLVAAIFEIQIHVDESHVTATAGKSFGLAEYRKTFDEGIAYLKEEPGLRGITAYFTANAVLMAAYSVICLPYFKGLQAGGEYLYVFIMGSNVLGRLIGGVFHYKHKFVPGHKFTIAIFVYCFTSLVDGIILYLPTVYFMCLLMFVNGLLGVTSYNIRISSTQSYVPSEKKG
ncbi:MAG: MFS transporter, partial [Treponemataceae bacterium]|nr:MFS transporter [Treponemataceae bacterium]